MKSTYNEGIIDKICCNCFWILKLFVWHFLCGGIVIILWRIVLIIMKIPVFCDCTCCTHSLNEAYQHWVFIVYAMNPFNKKLIYSQTQHQNIKHEIIENMAIGQGCPPLGLIVCVYFIFLYVMGLLHLIFYLLTWIFTFGAFVRYHKYVFDVFDMEYPIQIVNETDYHKNSQNLQQDKAHLDIVSLQIHQQNMNKEVIDLQISQKKQNKTIEMSNYTNNNDTKNKQEMDLSQDQSQAISFMQCFDNLKSMGFNTTDIDRAMSIYKKQYGSEYYMESMITIITNLSNSDQYISDSHNLNVDINCINYQLNSVVQNKWTHNVKKYKISYAVGFMQKYCSDCVSADDCFNILRSRACIDALLQIGYSKSDIKAAVMTLLFEKAKCGARKIMVHARGRRGAFIMFRKNLNELDDAVYLIFIDWIKSYFHFSYNSSLSLYEKINGDKLMVDNIDDIVDAFQANSDMDDDNYVLHLFVQKSDIEEFEGVQNCVVYIDNYNDVEGIQQNNNIIDEMDVSIPSYASISLQSENNLDTNDNEISNAMNA
eukprot:374665_1